MRTATSKYGSPPLPIMNSSKGHVNKYQRRTSQGGLTSSPHLPKPRDVLFDRNSYRLNLAYNLWGPGPASTNNVSSCQL
ncbi:hypothetical protein MTR_3g094610 [Medicago truncatula]|uniref:Uncharacterized protein n=1 Tax=Medicago truncatula TaxID=3880 RepID=G7J9R8_MEDTR|nr:hypothetical protein MTR_3g094610 [Medicago truncatula]